MFANVDYKTASWYFQMHLDEFLEDFQQGPRVTPFLKE